VTVWDICFWEETTKAREVSAQEESVDVAAILSPSSLFAGVRSVDALIHLIRDQVPATTIATVITAAQVKQVVVVLKSHALIIGGGLVDARAYCTCFRSLKMDVE
jgi:hypothetical protein